MAGVLGFDVFQKGFKGWEDDPSTHFQRSLQSTAPVFLTNLSLPKGFVFMADEIMALQLKESRVARSSFDSYLVR